MQEANFNMLQFTKNKSYYKYMGDRNIDFRSITGLNPIQDIVCDRLDLVQKITLDGSAPIAVQFLGYDPTTIFDI